MKIKDYRNKIRQLERLYHVHRPACVGVDELRSWCGVAASLLAELESLQCSRAKPADEADKAKICAQVAEFLARQPCPVEARR